MNGPSPSRPSLPACPEPVLAALDARPTSRTATVRRNAWWVFLACAGTLSVLYLIGDGTLSKGPVFNVVGVLGVAAILGGIRIHRPAVPGAWALLAAAVALFVAGDVISYNYASLFQREQPFPSLADAPYLGVYPVAALGLLVLIRHRNPGRDRASLVDSLIVAVGLGLLSWTFLMAPYARDARLDLPSRLVSIGYPMMDALLLAVAVRMAVGRGGRGPSYWLVVAGLGTLLVTDTLYTWRLLHGGYAPGGLLDVGWLGFYLLWGTAALHPSMTRVSATSERRSAVTRRRLALVGLATFLAPAAQLVQAARDDDDGLLVGPIGAIVLFALALLRMTILVKAQQGAAERERTLREAGASLVTATSSQEIIGAAEAASESLAGGGSNAAFHRVVEHGGELHLVASTRRSGDAGPTRPLGTLPVTVVDRLGEHRAALLDDPSGLVAGTPGQPALVLPVVARGELTGLIALSNAMPDAATVAGLESLALQAGLALESAELTEDLLRAEGEARFRALVQHSSDVVLVLSDALVIRYASPSAAGVLGYDERDLVGRDLATIVAEDDRDVTLSAIDALLRRDDAPSELLEFRVRHRGGQLVHAESLVSDLLQTPAIAGIVMNLRDVTERKEFERQLAHQAFHDPVTGLANRALFRDRITHALRRRRERDTVIALMFFDLDDFKMVNDTLGHLAGDTLLQTIGARLQGALRGGDTAARLGGDEFAVLVEDMADGEAIEAIADRLLEAVREPVALEGKEVVVRCSMGIAVSSEEDEDAEGLLRNADIAMYAAKSGGKDKHVTFATEMRRSVVEKVDLLADLRAAVAGDQLHLVYQPIVEIGTGRVAGLEALLRWQNPRLGPVSPARFIPLAEESGLIVELGQWVLDRACRDAVALRGRLEDAPEWMTVNISAWQLQRPEIVDEVREALAASGLEPSRLVLEITESMMIRDIDLAVARLTSLRDLGVMIAVDDFGTGYSSLNHIRRLPINTLKIDRSFVERLHEDEHQRKLTATIVDLARALDLKSVAEGVEHAEQIATLRRLGCGYAQGYHLSHPLRLEELVPRLATIAPVAA